MIEAPSAELRCRRGPLDDDEVPEQYAECLGLQRVRVDGQEVIPEDALLFVTNPVGVQHLLAALRARHHDEGPHHHADAAFATEHAVRAALTHPARQPECRIVPRPLPTLTPLPLVCRLEPFDYRDFLFEIKLGTASGAYCLSTIGLLNWLLALHHLFCTSAQCLSWCR